MARRTARQIAASRRNIIKAQKARKRGAGRRPINKKKVAIAAGVATAAVAGVAAYKVDQRKNTMMVYHATTHSRAKRIHKQGFEPRHRKRAYANHNGNGKMHEAGRVFLSTKEKSIRSYGPAITSSRIRKSKFKKYAKQDVHPKSLEGEKFGFKSRNGNHYHMQVSDMKKAGVKLRYRKQARATAGKKIRTRWEQGPYRGDY